MAATAASMPSSLLADAEHMREALAEAACALAVGETPVGCVFTAPDGRIVARGHNLTSATCNVCGPSRCRGLLCCGPDDGGMPGSLLEAGPIRDSLAQATAHAELVALQRLVRDGFMDWGVLTL